MEAPIPSDEPARLGSLYRLDVLDREPNAHFDRVTRLAAKMFDVPIALVSLVDADRQWFGSRVGLDATETPRCDAFCAHAILQPEVFQVNDASADRRFADNPLVTGHPHIRFYAGAPISAPSGHQLGTLCIIDKQPRSLGGDDQRALRDLADLIDRELSVADIAFTDQLTGLSNRRAFERLGAQLLDLAHRRNEPISMLFADVDGLKALNDERGHAVGDQLLQRAATVLRSGLRRSDLLARVGGDEFTAVLYGAEAERAAKAAAALRDVIAEHNHAASDLPPLAVSLGHAVADTGEGFAQLVERADAAMYENKRRRNPAGATGTCSHN